MTYTPRYRAPNEEHVAIVVDPGKWQCGASVWHVDAATRGGAARASRLVDARLVKYTDALRGGFARGRPQALPHRPGIMVGALLLLRVATVDAVGRALPVVWIVERPVKYANKHAAHKDVAVLLAVIAGLRRAVSRQGADADAVFERTPFRWKGNVPKKTHHRRVLGAGVLTVGELDIAAPFLDEQCVAYQPDVADAIAFGCFETGRVRRGGVR